MRTHSRDKSISLRVGEDALDSQSGVVAVIHWRTVGSSRLLIDELDDPHTLRAIWIVLP
jgi:hypothetical protein